MSVVLMVKMIRNAYVEEVNICEIFKPIERRRFSSHENNRLPSPHAKKFKVMNTSNLSLITFLICVSRIAALCDDLKVMNNSTLGDQFLTPKIHHRQKRNPVFPEGSSIGLKWSLSFALRSVRPIAASLQITHQVKIPVRLIYPESEIRRIDQHDVEYLEGNGIDDQLLGYFPKNNSVLRNENEISSWEEEEEINKIRNNERIDRLKSREDRLIFFKDILSFIQKMGLPAQPCLLRLICEIGHMPESSSLFGDMLLLLMRPSVGGRTEYYHEDKIYDEFVDAELYGRNVGRCHSKYNDCPASPLIFVYNLLRDVFS